VVGMAIRYTVVGKAIRCSVVGMVIRYWAAAWCSALPVLVCLWSQSHSL
jgi:hypothetical protein